MKYLFLITLLIILTYSNINSKETSDQYMVIAYNGLNLRESPSSKSKSLALIKQGTILTISGKDYNFETLDGLKNTWHKTIYMGKIGWVFGGYIINYSENDCNKVFNSILIYNDSGKIILRKGLYSNPEVVSTIPICQNPSISSDGTKIIYTLNDSDRNIYIYNISTKQTSTHPTIEFSQLQRAYFTPKDKYVMTESSTGSFSGYGFYDPISFKKVYESGTFENHYWINENELVTYLPEKGTQRKSEEQPNASSLCIVNVRLKSIQYINRASNLSEPRLIALIPNYAIFSILKVNNINDWQTNRIKEDKTFVCNLKKPSQITEISNCHDKQFLQEKNEYDKQTKLLKNIESKLIDKLFKSNLKVRLYFKSVPSTKDNWYLFIVDIDGSPTGELYIININNLNTVHIVCKNINGIYDYAVFNK